MNGKIDSSGCIGCGLCVEICPSVFSMSQNDLAEVYGEVTKENINSTLLAAESCPTGVISIEK